MMQHMLNITIRRQISTKLWQWSTVRSTYKHVGYKHAPFICMSHVWSRRTSGFTYGS